MNLIQLQYFVFFCYCTGDPDAIIAAESLFLRTMNQLEQDILSDVPPTELCSDSKLQVIRPLIDRLGAGLRALNPNLETNSLFANFFSSRQLVGAHERALFCPQRKPLMQLALWFSRSFCTAQVNWFEYNAYMQFLHCHSWRKTIPLQDSVQKKSR